MMPARRRTQVGQPSYIRFWTDHNAEYLQNGPPRSLRTAQLSASQRSVRLMMALDDLPLALPATTTPPFSDGFGHFNQWCESVFNFIETAIRSITYSRYSADT